MLSILLIFANFGDDQMRQILEILENNGEMNVDCLARIIRNRGVLMNNYAMKYRLKQLKDSGQIEITDNFRVKLAEI